MFRCRPGQIIYVSDISFSSLLVNASNENLNSILRNSDIFFKIKKNGVTLFDSRLMDFIYYYELMYMRSNFTEANWRMLTVNRTSFRKSNLDGNYSNYCQFLVRDCNLYLNCDIEIINRTSENYDFHFLLTGSTSVVDYFLDVSETLPDEEFCKFGYDSISYSIANGGAGYEYNLHQNYSYDGFVQLFVDGQSSSPCLAPSYFAPQGVAYFLNTKSVSFIPVNFEDYNSRALKVLTKQN